MLNTILQYCKYCRLQKTYIEFSFSFERHEKFISVFRNAFGKDFTLKLFSDSYLIPSTFSVVYKVPIRAFLNLLFVYRYHFTPVRTKDSKGNIHLKSLIYVKGFSKS